MSERVVYLTDRTTATTDWKCGMARWWYKHEGGQGIVPLHTPEYFEVGREIHHDMEQIALNVPLEDIIGAALAPVRETNDQLKLEVAYRRAAWAAGVAMFVEPPTRAKFETVALEHELILDRSPLWYACTPDRILRQLEDAKRKVYREYKSVGRVNRGWVAHWPKAVQVHVGLAAEGEETGEYPAYGEIMGLYKGEWKEGYLHHPYIWAWVKGSVDNPNNWTHQYKPGLERHPVWEFPLGVVEWVRRCGEEVAASVFPFSAPIFLDSRLLRDHIIARTHREQEVEAVAITAQFDRDVRARYFEPRYEQCEPVIGVPCPYLAACHNKDVNRDPLGSGLFVERKPHHLVEVLGVE